MISKRLHKNINYTNYNAYYDLVNLINLNDKELKKRYNKDINNWYIDITEKIDLYFNLYYSNKDSKNLRKEILENYNLIYNNHIDMRNYEDIIKPYSEDIENILEIEHYDIITNRLNVLVGEEILRPDMYKIVHMGEKNTKWIKDKKKELLINLLNQTLNKEVNENEEFVEEETNQMVQEQLELINSDFISKYEEIFNRILKYLYERDNYKQLENQSIYTYLGTGCCIFKVYEKNNDVSIRLVNPTLIDFEFKGEVYDISNSMCYREYRYLNFNELINEYGEYLSQEDINYLLNNVEQDKILNNSNNILKSFNYNILNSISNEINYSNNYECIEYEFKRNIRAKLLKYIDENGEEMEEIVPIDFEVPKELGIIEKEINIIESHEVVRINNCVYIKMNKVKNSFRDIDTYTKVSSSYNGIVTKFNLVSKVKNLQALYNLIMYFLKKEMIRAKGKVFVMDIAQIPKSYGWDVEKWLYYLDVFGIIGINSLEKNDINERATFNQFQQIDLSLGNTINSYIAQLETIKREVIEIIGVNQQRIGMPKSTETLGGIERSVTQSIAITEPYIEYYRKGFKNALEATINLIKYVYPYNKKIEYTSQLGTKELILLNDPDIFLQSYGIVLTDNKKFKGIIDFMQEYSRNLMMQGGITAEDFIRIIKSNSIEEIELILKLSEIKKQEQLMQQQQLQQQQQEILQQQQQQQFELELQKLEIEKQYKLGLIEIEKQKLELERLKMNITKKVEIE